MGRFLRWEAALFVVVRIASTLAALGKAVRASRAVLATAVVGASRRTRWRGALRGGDKVVG